MLISPDSSSWDRSTCTCICDDDYYTCIHVHALWISDNGFDMGIPTRRVITAYEDLVHVSNLGGGQGNSML